MELRFWTQPSSKPEIARPAIPDATGTIKSWRQALRASLTESSATENQENRIDMLAQDIALFLKNGTVNAQSFSLERLNTMDYYESLKAFTRAHTPLCDKMGDMANNANGGNVFEKDVLPIVYYAIRRKAEDVISGKSGPLNFSLDNRSAMRDDIIEYIKRHAFNAADALREPMTLARLKHFMPHEAPENSLAPLPRPVSAEEMARRADIIKLCIQSESEAGDMHGRNFYAELKNDIIASLSHTLSGAAKEEKAVLLIDNAIMECAQVTSLTGEYKEMIGQMHGNPEALYILLKPYTHKQVVIENRTEWVLRALKEEDPKYPGTNFLNWVYSAAAENIKEFNKRDKDFNPTLENVVRSGVDKYVVKNSCNKQMWYTVTQSYPIDMADEINSFIADELLNSFEIGQKKKIPSAMERF